MRLLSPLTLPVSGRTLPNRIWLAPMTNCQSHDDGTLGDDELEWLRRRAAGGLGTIVTCAAHVMPSGQGFDGQLGVFDDRHDEGLARLATTLRSEGAISIVQLYHGGARSPRRLTGLRPLSASERPDPDGRLETPRAGTAEDLEAIEHAFVSAALRCQRAGFDGIEVHGAHGYLFTQFLTTRDNQRTDAWGGSLETRGRLLLDTIRGIRTACDPRFIVGVRLSPWGYGLDPVEAVQIGLWSVDEKVDFVHVSSWDTTQTYENGQTPTHVFRQMLPAEVPVIGSGTIWSRSDAERVLDDGADLIALGKSAIGNADWGRSVAVLEWEPSRPPWTPAQLAAEGVGPRFVTYLRRFNNLVHDE